MKDYVGKLFILEGILWAIVGVLFFFNPGGSLFNFTLIVGVLIIIAAISKMFKGWHTDFRWYAIILGIIDALFGLILIFCPVATIEYLLLFYGIWSLIRGIFNLCVYIKDKAFGFNWKTVGCFVDIIVGLIVVLCPYVLLFLLPFIPYLLGIYFIFLGVSEFYLGFKS